MIGYNMEIDRIVNWIDVLLRSQIHSSLIQTKRKKEKEKRKDYLKIKKEESPSDN
jgi:hypothetical protein